MHDKIGLLTRHKIAVLVVGRWVYTCSDGPCRFLNIGDTNNIWRAICHW